MKSRLRPSKLLMLAVVSGSTVPQAVGAPQGSAKPHDTALVSTPSPRGSATTGVGLAPPGALFPADEFCPPIIFSEPQTEIGGFDGVVCGGSGVPVVAATFGLSPLGNLLSVRAVNTDCYTILDSRFATFATGNWDTSLLDEGIYVFQYLTGDDGALRLSKEAVVWLSQDFDTLSVSAPRFVGGNVYFDGTVNDENCLSFYGVRFRPAGGGAFQPIDPGQPTYTGPVINGRLATWDTSSIPDGPYEIEVFAYNQCGDSLQEAFSLQVDNTPPEAAIDFITESAPDVFEIAGTATDVRMHLWALSFIGGAFTAWQPIVPSSDPGQNATGELALWDTSGLPPGDYVVRLAATDLSLIDGSVPQSSETYATVRIGCAADLDGNGVLNLDDLDLFVADFLSGTCD